MEHRANRLCCIVKRKRQHRRAAFVTGRKANVSFCTRDAILAACRAVRCIAEYRTIPGNTLFEPVATMRLIASYCDKITGPTLPPHNQDTSGISDSAFGEAWKQALPGAGGADAGDGPPRCVPVGSAPGGKSPQPTTLKIPALHRENPLTRLVFSRQLT